MNLDYEFEMLCLVNHWKWS